MFPATCGVRGLTGDPAPGDRETGSKYNREVAKDAKQDAKKKDKMMHCFASVFAAFAPSRSLFRVGGKVPALCAFAVDFQLLYKETSCTC